MVFVYLVMALRACSLACHSEGRLRLVLGLGFVLGLGLVLVGGVVGSVIVATPDSVHSTFGLGFAQAQVAWAQAYAQAQAQA